MIPGTALLRRIEAMGVRGILRRWSLVPPELAKRTRPHVARVGDGVLTLMSGSDALRVNRLVGFGHLGGAREDMLPGILARCGEARVRRLAIELGAGPQAGEIAEWLPRHGFRRHRGYRLLLRDCRLPVPRLPGRVRVVRARRADAATVTDIMGDVFGLPDSRRSWTLATARAPENIYHLALAGRTPAGVGAMRAERGLAWLAGGAVLTRFRRRGAHTALITARLRLAARLGCRWVWTETTEPAPGRPDGSRRNMLRLGFIEAGTRSVFVWSDPRPRRRRLSGSAARSSSS